MKAHEIDYEIHGEEMQFVEIELDPQEGVVAEAGSFMMMDDAHTRWIPFLAMVRVRIPGHFGKIVLSRKKAC